MKNGWWGCDPVGFVHFECFFITRDSLLEYYSQVFAVFIIIVIVYEFHGDTSL